ncbi:MAG: hypothetical protein QGH15_21685, partial [Kiritimatiellia bacterium]|nr:hypothetical protein [Kiritimatiellia bacterium]
MKKNITFKTILALALFTCASLSAAPKAKGKFSAEGFPGPAPPRKGLRPATITFFRQNYEMQFNLPWQMGYVTAKGVSRWFGYAESSLRNRGRHTVRQNELAIPRFRPLSHLSKAFIFKRLRRASHRLIFCSCPNVTRLSHFSRVDGTVKRINAANRLLDGQRHQLKH